MVTAYWLIEKALLPMALNGTEKGKHFAAQAIAKIAITADPKMAFPGQRVQYSQIAESDTVCLMKMMTGRLTETHWLT